MILAALLALMVVAGLPPLWRWRPASKAGASDVELVGSVVGLCLRSGMSLSRSLGEASEVAHRRLAAEIRIVLRLARGSGLSAAMAAATGSCSGLLHRLARAADTGAPLVAVVDAYVHAVAADAHAEAIARVRRLPVMLVFPVALLMLPGLVLIVTGPALLDALSRFS